MKGTTAIPFYILLGVITALFFALFIPFIFPIFWAAVLAGIFKPLGGRLRRRLPPALAASLVVVIIIAIIIIPVGIVGSLLIAESIHLYDTISQDRGLIEMKIRSLQLPELSRYLARLGISEGLVAGRIAEMLKGLADFIIVHLTSITQNTLVFFVKFLIMLYSLFFFLKDGERLYQSFIRYNPLGSRRGRILYERFIATANAGIKATLIIGGIQGILGALIFYAVGIQGAVIWGIIMMFASVVPLVGSSIIWGPAGIIMLLAGHLWEGAAILAFGIVVIGLADNLLKPIIIGRGVQMHPLIVFFSTLGGLAIFGISGFVLGPVIASLFVVSWDMFEEPADPNGAEKDVHQVDREAGKGPERA